MFSFLFFFLFLISLFDLNISVKKQDKVDERLEREEMLAAAAFQEQQLALAVGESHAVDQAQCVFD